MITPIVLATRSLGKLRELEPIFVSAGVPVCTLETAGIAPVPNEDAVEAFETFEENALAKARFFLARSAGHPVVADDSGLEVDVLGGRPGVRSRRWSGRADLEGVALDDANNAYLLEELRGAPDRRARYVCAAAWCDGEREVVVRGETRGRILEEARGHNGFGYDPYFWSDELGATFGEATREAKEAVSHRGRAFHALLRRLGVRR